MIDDKINKKYLFPKKIPKLTSEQKLIKDDFMEHWLKVLRKNYGILDRFNHKVVVNNKPKNFLKTLEIGAGLGEHLNYEKLNDDQKKNYYAMDIRENLLKIMYCGHILLANMMKLLQRPILTGYMNYLLKPIKKRRKISVEKNILSTNMLFLIVLIKLVLQRI